MVRQSNIQTIENSWQRVVDLSQSILQLALEKNWGAISELAIDRHQSVLQHFVTFPVGPETAGFYTHRIDLFLKQEEKIKDIAGQARKKAMKEGVLLQQNRRAVEAYHNS
ncbi:hypothetical protein LCGC14_3019130 [marine sediment metagenome]|uniref:Flagellar protein FliT n=1 Tax=marine sediment metagenome TaxID=412755 RepID=A0A0F8XIR5_9ZZZZ